MVRAVKMRFLTLLAALFGAASAVPPALALGGAAAGGDSALQPHLVMVLSVQGARHGACTGTVIAPDIVLTAAHCVAGNRQVAVAYAENGSHVLQRVHAKAINPGFSGKARVSIDLALIRLDGRLPARFKPLPLDRGEGLHAIGESRRIAGFGLAVDRDEASAGKLRSADVTILPRIFPRFMRLGRSDNADLSDLAICTGDSGGPVIDGGLVVGVVYGREKFANAAMCGTIAQAVRLAPQRAWIDGVLSKWGVRQQ
jgi:secreted trypsin-like serine protease